MKQRTPYRVTAVIALAVVGILLLVACNPKNSDGSTSATSGLLQSGDNADNVVEGEVFGDAFSDAEGTTAVTTTESAATSATVTTTAETTATSATTASSATAAPPLATEATEADDDEWIVGTIPTR